MPIQVPFPFKFHGNQDFDSYFPGPNQQILDALKALVQNNRDRFLFIWGPSGLGKSHLLQATCQTAVQLDRGVFYLPLKELAKFNPELLEGLETCSLVCIDDIDRIAGIPDWETAFFHFFNRHRERLNSLVISASQPPAGIRIQLPDLASRLQWGLTLQIQNMSDTDKLGALTVKAKRLGFSLPDEVGRFLLSRYPRDLPTLWSILQALDYASLSEQRKLTIPFLKLHLQDR